MFDDPFLDIGVAVREALRELSRQLDIPALPQSEWESILHSQIPEVDPLACAAVMTELELKSQQSQQHLARIIECLGAMPDNFWKNNSRVPNSDDLQRKELAEEPF